MVQSHEEEELPPDGLRSVLIVFFFVRHLQGIVVIDRGSELKGTAADSYSARDSMRIASRPPRLAKTISRRRPIDVRTCRNQ